MAPTNISPKQFANVIKKNRRVILDVWAEWCQPCTIVLRSLKLFGKTNPDIYIARIDADAYPDFVERLNVRGLPTLLYIENGKIRARQIGGIDYLTLKEYAQNIFEQ